MLVHRRYLSSNICRRTHRVIVEVAFATRDTDLVYHAILVSNTDPTASARPLPQYDDGQSLRTSFPIYPRADDLPVIATDNSFDYGGAS